MMTNNRKSLSYFPVDTMFSIPMRKLTMHYGPEGIGIVILILQMIYHEGYALTWDDETCYLFCRENNIDKKTVQEILRFCLKQGIFDRTLYREKKILSSAEIQKQWLKICQQSKRKGMSIEHGVSLLDQETDRFAKSSSGKTPKDSGNLPENSGSLPENSAQRKEKKIKEKKIKENKNKKNKSEEDRSGEKRTRAEAQAPELWPALSVLPKASDPGMDDMKARFQRIIREKERQEHLGNIQQIAAGQPPGPKPDLEAMKARFHKLIREKNLQEYSGKTPQKAAGQPP